MASDDRMPPPNRLVGEYADIEVGCLWPLSDGQKMICESIETMATSWKEADNRYGYDVATKVPTWVRYNEDGADDDEFVLVAWVHPWAICKEQLETTRDMVAKLGIETLNYPESCCYSMLMHQLQQVVANIRLGTDVSDVRTALRRLRAGSTVFYDEEIAERLFDQLMDEARWEPMMDLTYDSLGSVGTTGAEQPLNNGTSTPIWKVEVEPTVYDDTRWDNGVMSPHDNLHWNEAPRDSPGTPMNNFAVASGTPMCEYKAATMGDWKP